MDLRDHIRTVPDFPKPGILFYDISTLLAHADAWAETVHQLADKVKPMAPDLLVGIESRGFLTAAPLALHMGIGFVMLRKPGKLPGETISHSYALEYGKDAIEVQAEAVRPGQRVAIMDDLLATGGTMRAGVQLMESIGAVVAGCACIVELTFLQGRSRITCPVETLVSYDN